MAKRKRWYVIGRGFNGWHAEGLDVSSSGGCLEDYTHWTGQKCKGYVSDAYSGCLVYDASEATFAAFSRLVMSGPMVSPKLGLFEVSRFSDKDRATAALMAPGLAGTYKALAIAAQDPEYGGLDCVGIGIYEKLLRKVPGIRIGKVIKGAVVWEKQP